MSDDAVTWRQLLARTTDAVSDRVVARWLCEHASGFDGAEFIDVLDEKVAARAGRHLDAMLGRYLVGEPLQYVMGRWAFRRLDLMVDRRVLIPRPETELIVDIANEFLDDVDDVPKVVVDLGTGSGAIGLSILYEAPIASTKVHLTDSSRDALDVARANSAGIGRAAVGMSLHEGRWYEALPEELARSCHLIVSNPPYIAVGDDEVEETVRNWEPHSALYSGADGLDDLRMIIGGATSWLVPGGLLLLEIGHLQGDAVRSLLHDAGLTELGIMHDLAGRVRFARGQAPR